MDLTSICRACLLSCEEMFPIFSQIEMAQAEAELVEMIMACTSVQVSSSDGLPNLICKTCVLDLSAAYNFKLKCEKNDAILREYYKEESKVEEILELPLKTQKDVKEELLEQYSGISELKLEGDCSTEDTVFFTEDTTENIQDDQWEDPKEVLPELYIKSEDCYICLECKASFSTLGNLESHLKIHVVKPLPTCPECNKSFTKTDSLAEHMKRHGKNQYECELCDKKYTTKTGLTSHMTTHDRRNGKIPKERLHECQFCQKTFLSNSSLVIHIRTHTKEKPFLCQTCGKGFGTRGGVDLHQRRHTGERPFKCEYCGRGFAESSNLKVHIRAHTGDRPHLCSLCGKRFTRMFLLQLHIRTHTGEKPYTCSDCPKAFAQQGDLAAHKRIHTGQRPHKCSVCTQGFIKSSGLKKHMVSKHRKEIEKMDAKDEVIELEEKKILN